MYAVTLRASNDRADFLIAELSEMGTAGVREEPGCVTAWFSAESDALACARRFDAILLGVESNDGEDYSANWQREWQPIEVGSRFYLAPPWDESETPAGRHRLNMRPGYVFGSGDHPTTQLCLSLLEHIILPEDRVLDVGTGTGILAIAAAALGAGFVAGCDVDVQAVSAASEEAPGLAIWLGSTGACRARSFSVVIANLPAGLLIDLLPELRRVLTRRGALIASGFFDEQIDEIRAALAGLGFAIERFEELGDWAAVVAR